MRPVASTVLIAALAIGWLAMLGCADSAGPEEPEPGSIRVQLETTGFDQDDGYLVTIDGQTMPVAPNGAVVFSGLAPGEYVIELTDVASNCKADASDPVRVVVLAGQTHTEDILVSCWGTPVTYTILFGGDWVNLDTEEIVDCGSLPQFCPPELDLTTDINSIHEVHGVIRQNVDAGTEIAHLLNVAFDDVTAADIPAAPFTSALVLDEPFDATRVILIRTDLGSVFKLGNPVKNDFPVATLTFDAALLTVP